MDILDYVNPVRKDSLADGDRMIVTNGRDIFAVPPTGGGSPDFPTVNDALGGIVSTDEEAQTGKLSVEDLIVALVGIEHAVKGAPLKNFSNSYNEKFDYDSVCNKLSEAHLIPADSSIVSIEIISIKALEKEGFLVKMEANVNPGEVGVNNNQSWRLKVCDGEGNMLDSATPQFTAQDDMYVVVWSFDLNANMAGETAIVSLERKSIGLFYKDLQLDQEFTVTATE